MSTTTRTSTSVVQQNVEPPKTIVKEFCIPSGIKYPDLDKNHWGPAYWFTFHQNASMYPDSPTDDNKQKQQGYIDFFINNLPCKIECGDSAKEFVSTNPPDLSSRKAYFGWTVKFHNWVNEHRGDPERVNANDLLEGEASCDKTGRCSLPGKEGQQQQQQQQAHNVDLAHSMEAYKVAVKQLVNDVCMKEGVEPPEIFFTKCSDGTDTSCMVYDRKTKKQVAFYHPKQLLDTILHEIDHHKDAKAGKIIDDSLNPKASRYSEEMIKKYFPFDYPSHDKNGVTIAHQHAQQATVIRESMPIPPAQPAVDPQQMVREVYDQPNQFSTEVEDPKILNEFPHLKQTLFEIKKEELKGEIREFEHKGGVLSHFDKAYAWPAKLTGLSAEQLNQLHTPTILAEIIFTVSGSFLAPLPRRIIVGLFAIFLMLMGVGYHKRMTVRDIQLIQLMGAQLLWGSTITALNPKNAKRLKKDFDRFAELAKDHNLHFKDIIETPDHDPEAFHPFSSKSSSQANFGKPIKQGANPIDDSVNYAENPEFMRQYADDSVIQLPKFTSRSHARFI